MHIIDYFLVCARKIYLIVRCPVRKLARKKYLLNGSTCTAFQKTKQNWTHYNKGRHLFNLKFMEKNINHRKTRPKTVSS